LARLPAPCKDRWRVSGRVKVDRPRPPVRRQSSPSCGGADGGKRNELLEAFKHLAAGSHRAVAVKILQTSSRKHHRSRTGRTTSWVAGQSIPGTAEREPPCRGLNLW